MATQPLPKPQEEPAREPPLVELVRERLRDSRLGGLARRYKSITAAIVGLLVLAKSWKWLLFDLIHNRGWLIDHWPITLGVAAAIFLVAFVGTRLGIGWFADDGDETEAAEAVIRARYQERELERARDAAIARR